MTFERPTVLLQNKNYWKKSMKESQQYIEIFFLPINKLPITNRLTPEFNKQTYSHKNQMKSMPQFRLIVFVLFLGE